MPRTEDGVHVHFHETTEHYTVEKNGVVSKNTRRRVKCLNKGVGVWCASTRALW
jgi:hypothetical protein